MPGPTWGNKNSEVRQRAKVAAQVPEVGEDPVRGDRGTAVDSEGNVLDWETTEMEITQELGLLSENEFESLAGFSGAAIKGELQKVPSHLGMDKSFFVITLDGLPCTVTNGMRKLRCKYRFGLTRQDMLLSAARQLVEGQGKVVFSYHSEEQLKQRPKGLQTDQQFKDLKSLDQLKEKAQKALAKSGAAPAKTKDESSSEADEDDDGPKEKKLKIQQSGRLQKAPKPKRKSKGQKARESRKLPRLRVRGRCRRIWKAWWKPVGPRRNAS